MTQWIPHGQILVPDTAPYADSRMINFTGLNGGGHTGYHELRRRAGSWPTTSATPSGPAELLKTSRDSYALGYYAYSLFAVAGTWSILAVEAALKLKLNTARNSNFKNLVKRAEAAGLLRAPACSGLTQFYEVCGGRAVLRRLWARACHVDHVGL